MCPDGMNMWEIEKNTQKSVMMHGYEQGNHVIMILQEPKGYLGYNTTMLLDMLQRKISG